MSTTALTTTPSRLSRLMQQVRQQIRATWSSSSPELARVWGASPVSAGIHVSEHTALNYSAFWAAVNGISGDVSSLPLNLYRRIEGGGKERYDAHPLYRILHDNPNPEMTSMTFRRTLMAHVLTWGNGYAEIERDGAGRVKALWPLMPYAVTPFRDSGRLLYRVANDGSNAEVIFNPSDILHVPGLGFDGTMGYSIVAKARESIGLGLAAERFGGSFFGNGSTMGGILSHPGKLGDVGRKNLKDSIEARHQGVDRAHKFMVLEEGMTYARVGINPDDAQFLETRQFQVAEIARWFNMPPHKLADLSRATFSNIEQQSIDYLRTTLMPWLEAWEQELMFKLISPLERRQQLIEHVTEGVLRGDAQARSEFYSKLFSIGAVTINEIRSRENLNPIPGGDTSFVPLNMAPLNRYNEYISAQIEGMKPAPPPPAPAPTKDEAELQEENDRLATQLAEERDTVVLYKAAVTEARAEANTLQQQLTDAQARIDAAVMSAAGMSAANEAEYNQRIAAEATAQVRADELAEARSAHASLTEQLIAAQTAVLNMDEKHERDVSALTLQIDEAIARLAEAQQERDAAAAMQQAASDALVVMGGLRDTERQRADSAEAELRDKMEAYSLDLTAITQERDAAEARATLAETQTREAQATHSAAQIALQASLAEADQHIVGVQTSLQAEREARAQAEADKAAAALARQSVEAARDDQQASVATLSAELEQVKATEQARMIGVIAAHRTLIADVMGRLVRREIANARKYQATPQKLLTWMASYYDDTEKALFVESLLPSVRVHLAWMQSPENPVDVAERMVDAHFTDSRKALTAIVDAGLDGYAELVQRTFQRWDSTRAHEFADGLMTEEIQHV